MTTTTTPTSVHSANGTVNGHITPKIAVGYIRESDPGQGGGTMKTQDGLVRRFIESEGFIFGGMYADKESGLLETRPDYQKMIQGARDGEFQVVVIPRFDRLGRDDAEYFPRLREFQKLGVEVLSASEPNGNNFVRGVLILMANEESRRLSMRIIPNKIRLASEGFWNSNPPIGYDLARLMPDGSLIPSETATQDQKRGSLGAILVPNDVAPFVAEALRMYADGKATMAGVQEYLRANGQKISRQGVYSMLKNKAYMGIVVHGVGVKSKFNTISQVIEAKGRHEALVDEDTFGRVQERLEVNAKMKRAAVGAKHLLSGLVFCGICDSTMKANTTMGGRYSHYACRSRRGEIAAETRCRMKGISERKLDAQVKELVLAALKPLALGDAREKARERLQAGAAKRTHDSDQKRKALERRRTELEERLTRAEDAMLDGLLGRERYIQRRDEIVQKLEGVKRKIDALPKTRKADTTAIFAALDSIDLDTLTGQEWRELLVLLVERVTWDGEKAVIEWKPEWRAAMLEAV